MKVKIKGIIGGLVCLLACAAASAQGPVTSSPRYYRMSPTSYSSMARYRTTVHGGGCADCGVAGPSCDGCDGGCGIPDCGHCCPGILPAVARGVGAVADFVGGTLDCIFCVPRHGCCEPASCCVRPRACGRPMHARRWCGHCGGIGCGDCGGCGMDGDFGPIPAGVPVEDAPVVPPSPPSEARVHRSSASSAARVMRGTATTPRKRTVATQASAIEEVKRTSAAPREFVVPNNEPTRQLPIREIGGNNSSQEALGRKASGKSLPLNPLRP